MTFEQFALAHGLVIRNLIEGRWIRVPTEDKPRHRNGSYKYMGEVGFVQNWATMTEPAVWKPEGAVSTTVHRRTRAVAAQAARQTAQNAARAAQKAEQILSECELQTHPYLERKGFPDELVNVWRDDKAQTNWMCVPMRRDGRVVGLQRISDRLAHERTNRNGEVEQVPAFEKKFLYGQRSELAEFVMGRGGTHVLCEGYATALSVRQALTNLKVTYTLHVTFSAANMQKVAERLRGGLVIADYDTPSRIAPEQGGMGWKVAREIGWPYWTSDTEKEDANDYALRKGVFSLAMGLKKVLMDSRRRA